jgi:hypothetical protein
VSHHEWVVRMRGGLLLLAAGNARQMGRAVKVRLLWARAVMWCMLCQCWWDWTSFQTHVGCDIKCIHNCCWRDCSNLAGDKWNNTCCQASACPCTHPSWFFTMGSTAQKPF